MLQQKSEHISYKKLYKNKFNNSEDFYFCECEIERKHSNWVEIFLLLFFFNQPLIVLFQIKSLVFKHQNEIIERIEQSKRQKKNYMALISDSFCDVWYVCVCDLASSLVWMRKHRTHMNTRESEWKWMEANGCLR